jgi:undecaprenyl-diphosphatase
VDLLWAALLGLVQGLTEFLPVSSSGHLVLVGHLIGLPSTGLVFELLLHLATLAAVVFYYRSDVTGLIIAVPRALRSPRLGYIEDQEVRLGLLIIAASVPTAVIGLAFKDQFEALTAYPQAVGAALLVTAALLLATLIKPRQSDLNLRVALLIGLAQGLAITPGISRSGATIALALLLGIATMQAARFSFLISIPAIAGAALLKLRDGLDQLELLPAMVGFLVASVSGYFALKWLVALVKARRFAAFAPYCAVVGLLAIGLAP